MADIDLIAGADSPFDPWVRDAVRALRTERDQLAAVIERVAAVCDGYGDHLISLREEPDVPAVDMVPVERIAELLPDADGVIHPTATYEKVYNAWYGRPLGEPWGGCADKAAIARVMELFTGKVHTSDL